MGECWYCYWGWPKVVHNIFVEAKRRLNGDDHPLYFGPAHIVWEDENWDGVEWCIENFDKYSGSLSEKEKEIVMWSLVELSKIPMDQRDPEPLEYKNLVEPGCHDCRIGPENYPPPNGMEMIGGCCE